MRKCGCRCNGCINRRDVLIIEGTKVASGISSKGASKGGKEAKKTQILVEPATSRSTGASTKILANQNPLMTPEKESRRQPSGHATKYSCASGNGGEGLEEHS
jgi:hypothetical protein